MKRIITTLLLFVIICQINTVKTAPDGLDEFYIICKPGTCVNVRISPNSHAEIIGSKFFGDVVYVDKEKNGFVHITNLNSEYTDGWVSKGLIVEDQPVEVNRSGVIVSNARVAGRKYVNGKVKTWLANGTEVTVYAESDEWCVTDKGYVRAEFIEIQEQENES